MNNITPFQFNTSTVRVITDERGEIWFIARDVAGALGYSDPAKAISTHCKRAKSLKDIGWANRLPYTNQELENLDPQVKLIPESDVYRLTMRSKLESAEVFQDWVAEEVLPSIRKTGSYSVKPSLDRLPPSMPELQVLDYLDRRLRMSDTSVIRAVGIICEDKGISTRFLPAYSDETLTMALGDLLKKHGSLLSAVKTNPILAELGLLERVGRRSAKGEQKVFWSITGTGLRFGKNETSVQNPNETQPRWYVSKFPELLDLINSWMLDESEAA